MVDLMEAWRKKIELVSKLGSVLNMYELEEAKRDSHARRLPRPCGLTIHTGLGCRFGCLYCYIYDMGFSRVPRPYPLSGPQLAYALVSNPSVAPGRSGTLMAFGSVTEPFMRETIDRTLEYLEAIARLLENPIQFSTKAWIDEKLATKLGSMLNCVSALVTIVSTSLHTVLEPGAPDPEKRFQTIRVLSGRGIHTCLFVRPMLPGLSEREFEDILAKAMDSGATGVVFGSMRVTGGIIERLKMVGYPHMSEIMSRIPGELKPGKQAALRMSDLKRRLMRLAEELGLKAYPSACAANIEAHELGCATCRLGPCGNIDKMPDVNERDLKELSVKYGVSLEKVVIDEFEISLVARGPEMKIAQLREFVKSVCKRKVVVRG